MARKSIPDEVQNSILTKSRRRCCLCFWLEGRDEVQKGQIAHLDQNNANPDEGNLAFLCFDHHDDYDGIPRLSKGLRESEVRHWRDELYREMEYRFRTTRTRAFELMVSRFIVVTKGEEWAMHLRLRNIGQSSVRSPIVSLRVPDSVYIQRPKEINNFAVGTVYFSTPITQPFQSYSELTGPYESQEDIFEKNGRVIKCAHPGSNPILMPAHSWEFVSLAFRLADFAEGSFMEMDYRVDAEEMIPFVDTFGLVIPTDYGDDDLGPTQ